MISVEFKIPEDKAHLANSVMDAIEAELLSTSDEHGELFTVSASFGESVYPVNVKGDDVDQLWIMDEIKKAVYRVGCAALKGK